MDKSRITIGDLILYTVTVTHDESVKPELPGLAANLGGFEIRDYNVHEPEKLKGLVVSTVDYTISTFLTGEFEIPPLTIAYTTTADTTRYFLSTEPIKITVESMKPSEDGDIRDIKPPLEIPRDWMSILRWAGLGALLALLAVLGYIAYRRKKAGKGLFPVREEPKRPPHEIAYEALESLGNAGYLERGEIKQYYIELSEIVRRYIGGRYFVVAMEMTTTEVLEGLEKCRVEPDIYEIFRNFLDNCDLVKFAKVIPGTEDIENDFRTAHILIDRTKVEYEETDSGTGEEGKEQDEETGLVKALEAAPETEPGKEEGV